MTVTALNDRSVGVSVLLAQIAEYGDELDAMVAVLRIDGCWRTVWTSGIDLGGLSMAAMKLSHDVTHEIHCADGVRVGFSGPEKAA